MDKYLEWLDEQIIIMQQRIAMINTRINKGEWTLQQDHEVVSIRLQTLEIVRNKYKDAMQLELADRGRDETDATTA